MTRRIIVHAITAITLTIALMSCGGGTQLKPVGSMAYTPESDDPPRPTVSAPSKSPPMTFSAAVSATPVAYESAPATPAALKPAASQPDELDRVIVEASDYLNEKISQGSKVAFVSARRTFPALSEYIIENLTENAVNDKVFTVVDRSQLDAIRSELEFQMSGDVSDSTVRSIGRILGVKTIVTVVVSQVGNMYRFGVRALEVESAEILGLINRNIPAGATISALAGAPAPTVSASVRSTAQPIQTGSPAIGQSATPALNAGSHIVPVGAVTPPGNTLAEQLAYIESKAGRGTIYDIVVKSNLETTPMTVSTMGRDITVIIRGADPRKPPTIQLDSEVKGSLLSVAANVTLKLHDVVFKGHGANAHALVAVGKNATLILNSGAKIIGNTNNQSWNGGGVWISGGVLEMNDGSEVSGNKVYSENYDRGADGGGIFVFDRGIVSIRGGAIIGNEVYLNSHTGGGSHGGGIYIGGNSTATISGGLFSKNIAHSTHWSGRGVGGAILLCHNSILTMTGGIISGNRATNAGGGVWVQEGSTFIKKPAEGSEESGVIYGATGQNANTAGQGGHAGYREFSNKRNRNTTLGAYDEISTASNEGWE